MALHIRSNHVHAVVHGHAQPEKMMNDFKSYASRTLNRQSRPRRRGIGASTAAQNISGNRTMLKRRSDMCCTCRESRWPCSLQSDADVRDRAIVMTPRLSGPERQRRVRTVCRGTYSGRTGRSRSRLRTVLRPRSGEFIFSHVLTDGATQSRPFGPDPGSGSRDRRGAQRNKAGVAGSRSTLRKCPNSKAR